MEENIPSYHVINLYQWEYLDGATWKPTTWSGAKTETLKIPVAAIRDGYQYRCTITASNGTTATSNAAKLTVK